MGVLNSQVSDADIASIFIHILEVVPEFSYTHKKEYSVSFHNQTLSHGQDYLLVTMAGVHVRPLKQHEKYIN